MNALEPNSCTLRIQIRQTVRPTVGVYYRIPQLASMWHRRPATIRWWLLKLRRSPHAPSPEQVTLRRFNAARRYVEIRDDYAALMRRVFMDRDGRLR